MANARVKRKRRASGRRHDRREIERLLGRRRREGLSYREVSELSGIPAATLQWWAWRLRSRRRGGPERGEGGELEFVEVQPAAPHGTPAATSAESRVDHDSAVEGRIEVRLRNGRVLRLSRGFDVAEVRALLPLLDGSC